MVNKLAAAHERQLIGDNSVIRIRADKKDDSIDLEIVDKGGLKTSSLSDKLAGVAKILSG